MEELKGVLPKLAALVSNYKHMFEDYSTILIDIDEEAGERKIFTIIRTVSSETSWVEPAAKWSTLYNCSYGLENNSLAVDLHFNVSLRDGSIKIMEAVPINFQDLTEGNDRGPTCDVWRAC